MPISGVSSDTHLARFYDSKLFCGPYFVIDADNRRTGTLLSTRPDDPAAVVVGKIRSDAMAIDIDLDDPEMTEWLLHHLVQWCEDHSTWYLHRGSGGGAARAHFYALPPAAAAEELRVYVGQLRDAAGADGRQIDVRDTLRLVSSPHRRGGARGPLTVSGEALPPRRQRGPQKPSTQRGAVYGQPSPTASLTASQRATARMVPAGPTRSDTEFSIVRRLKARGAEPEAVWNALNDPELRPDIGHAAERNYAWFRKNMWSKITVTEDISRPSSRSRKEYDWSRYALPASRAVRKVWGQWSTRHKHTVEHVAVVAAARLGPLGAAGGPLPLRDLVEDTGRDLKTVRGALASLRSAGILTRVKSFTLGRDAATSSDHYALTVELPAEASLTPTPRSYTPADPLWLGLAPSALSLTLTTLHESASPLDLPTILRLSGFQIQRSPSTRQKTLTVPVLASLCERSVLSQDSPGAYRNSTKTKVVRPRAGLRRWSALRERHAVERKAFRELVEELFSAAKARWDREREECLERLKVRRRQRQLAWWEGLSQQEREHRRKVWKESWRNSDPRARLARLRKLVQERPSSSDWTLAA